MSKECSKCLETKTTTDFPVCRTNRDGLHTWCRVCHSNYSRANKDRKWAYERQRRKDKAEQHKAVDKAWRMKNFERLRGYRERSTFVRDKDKARVVRRNRRARIRNAAGKHTAHEIRELMKRQSGKCACCNKNIRKSYHADHITPLFRGGSNFIRNIQLLCPTCNTRKSYKDPIAFMQEMGRLL